MSDEKVTLRGKWLGQRLRSLRTENGMTLDDVADYLQRNPGTVSRFESGVYPIRRPDVLALLDLYGVADPRHRDGLMRLSESLWQKGWWDGYADDVTGSFIDYVWVESEAAELRFFENTLIPGLLQTPEYAEAWIRAADERDDTEAVTRLRDLRMKRQEILHAAEPTRLQVVLDEAVLHRRVGDDAVHLDQLRHLVQVSRQANIALRVLPFETGAHASPTGTFRICLLDDPYPDVAYIETPKGAIYVESPDVQPIAQRYDRLWNAGASERNSVQMINALIKDRE